MRRRCSTDRSASGLAQAQTTPERIKTDVVVVGGGGSGLAAAIEARTLGRNVILLEKRHELGGTTARSVGSITAANTPHQIKNGILDSPDDHFEDLCAINAKLGLENNLVLARLLVDNVPETFEWLMSMGIRFHGPLSEPPHRKPRLHNVVPNSRAYIYHLARRARRIGVNICTSVRAREIKIEGGCTSGVVCETASGNKIIEAKGIVLATGDFGGNPEMVAEYIPAMAGVPAINAENTGDGHQMVLALGGRIVHPQLHQGGIRFQPPPPRWITQLPPSRVLTEIILWAMKNAPTWLLRPFVMSFLTSVLVPDASLYTSGALLINKHGERFTDELTNPAGALSQHPDQTAFILLDGRLTKKFSAWPHFISTAPGVAYAYVADYRRGRKDVFHEGETLAELALSIGVPAERLEVTVREYNCCAREGHDTSRRIPFDTGPYIALGPVRRFLQFADSGVAVDSKLRVLRGDEPIESLFAAGFLGMGGALLWGHGHHLGWAFTSGRIAGRHAAYRAVSKDLPKH